MITLTENKVSGNSELSIKHAHIMRKLVIIAMVIWPFHSVLQIFFFTFSIQRVRGQSWRWVFQAIFKHKPELVRNLLEQNWGKNCWSLSCREGKAPGGVTSSALHLPLSSCRSRYPMDRIQGAAVLSTHRRVGERAPAASPPLPDVKKVGEDSDQESFPGCF